MLAVSSICLGDILLIDAHGERWLVYPQKEAVKTVTIRWAACPKGLANPVRGNCAPLNPRKNSGEFHRNLAAAFAIPSEFAGVDALKRVTLAIELQREEIDDGRLSEEEHKAIFEKLRLNEQVQRKLVRIQKFIIEPLNQEAIVTLDSLYQLDPSGLDNAVAIVESITSTLVRIDNMLFRIHDARQRSTDLDIVCVSPFRPAEKRDISETVANRLKAFFHARFSHETTKPEAEVTLDHLVWIKEEKRPGIEDMNQYAYYLLEGHYYGRRKSELLKHLCIKD